MRLFKPLILVTTIASALVISFAVAKDADVSCATTGKPAQLEGKVVNVDISHEKITVRDSNDTLHEFQATTETLQKYKAGDPIKAKLRCER